MLDDGEVSLPVGAIGDSLYHEVDEFVFGQGWKTKEKNAYRTWALLPECQRPEILIEGDKQSLLVVGTLEDDPVVDPRLHGPDPRYVVALLSKCRHDR